MLTYGKPYAVVGVRCDYMQYNAPSRFLNFKIADFRSHSTGTELHESNPKDIVSVTF